MSAALRKVWPVLSQPVMPADTDLRARAQSILTGSLLHGKVCGPLTTDEARDVLAWHHESMRRQYAREQSSVTPIHRYADRRG